VTSLAGQPAQLKLCGPDSATKLRADNPERRQPDRKIPAYFAASSFETRVAAGSAPAHSEWFNADGQFIDAASDAGDQFIDTASQSVAQRRFALEPNQIVFFTFHQWRTPRSARSRVAFCCGFLRQTHEIETIQARKTQMRMPSPSEFDSSEDQATRAKWRRGIFIF
jgi:hypothetical protein